MPQRAKYAELVIPSDTSLPRRVTGMVIVSDYTSDGKRHLFLKKLEAEPKPAAVAPRKRRARRVKQVETALDEMKGNPPQRHTPADKAMQDYIHDKKAEAV